MFFKKKIYWSIIILLLLLLGSCGSVRSKLAKADKQFANGEYFLAAKNYKSAYSRISYKDKPLRGATAFKQAECYRHINYFRTEQVYKNAIRNRYNDSIVFLRIAQVQHKLGKYRDAIANYNIYLMHDSTNRTAKDGLKGVLIADSLERHPSQYKVRQMREFVASRSTAFSPAFTSFEADALVFTSNRKLNKKDKKQKANNVNGAPNNHIFISKLNKKGKWEKPEPLEGEMLTNNDEGVTSFTGDGRSIFFTRSLTEGNKGEGTVILQAERAGGEWGTPKQLELFKDSTISVAHPAISPDGQTLYFVSDAPNGMGGTDIWRAKKDGDKWSFVENLGADINSSENEMFPTIREDGTLYFSSNGHSGLGGLDIYRAIPTDSTGKSWQVTNMGVPINSAADDFGITFEGDKDCGFFSSSRKESRNYDKIWRFDHYNVNYILQGKIDDKSGNRVGDGALTIIGNDGENARFLAKKDGTFEFTLKQGVHYAIMVSARGYLNLKDTLSVPTKKISENEIIERKYSLSPVFQPVRIDNIYYDFDKSTLRPDSKKGLEELVKLLKDNPNVTIEMSSHTDYKGDYIYNRDLSLKRAQSVVDYLITQGIEPGRLTAAGYGEGKPFVVDKKQNEKYPFLPIGTQLTEKFVLSLEPEQQEIANQINRRTEFKVTSTSYNLY